MRISSVYVAECLVTERISALYWLIICKLEDLAHYAQGYVGSLSYCDQDQAGLRYGVMIDW